MSRAIALFSISKSTPLISALTFVALLIGDPIYQKVAVGAAIWYVLGLLYFAFIGRKNLVYSPEEAFAVRAREEGKGS